MPDFVDNLHEQVRIPVKLAWPEVVSVGSVGRRKRTGTQAGGMWDELHIETIPYDQLSTPYSVIDVNELQSANGQYGSVNDSYLCRVEVWRFDDYNGGFGPLWPSLMRLRRELNRYDSTKMQMMEGVENMSTSSSLRPNQVLAAKGASVRCARLIFTVLVGESYRSED